MLELTPISFKDAKAFVQQHHRHHKPPQGWKFGVACSKDGQIVGVAMAGRPVSRMLDDGITVEVTRCCTDGTRNACSMLYGAIWKASKSLGYKKCITYILEDEIGSSLKAVGWKRIEKLTRGGSWNRKNREREDKHPLQKKIRWEIENDRND